MCAKKVSTLPERPEPEQSWRDALESLPFFSGLISSDVDRLALCAYERRMRRGEVLMRAGDPGHSMMVVVLGEVRVVLSGLGGQQQTVSTLGPGSVFGEIALFDGKARTADIVAATNGKVLAIERETLLRMIQHDSKFALRVIELICTHLRSTLVQLESILFQDVATRLAASLLKLAQGKPPRHIDITQAALGQLIGGSREIVNKRLRSLEHAGIVSLAPGRVLLLDEVRLTQTIPGRVENS
jgi:CRP/FNR family transcriptional regulator, cyclic AMP receptor protein